MKCYGVQPKRLGGGLHDTLKRVAKSLSAMRLCKKIMLIEPLWQVQDCDVVQFLIAKYKWDKRNSPSKASDNDFLGCI